MIRWFIFAFCLGMCLLYIVQVLHEPNNIPKLP